MCQIILKQSQQSKTIEICYRQQRKQKKGLLCEWAVLVMFVDIAGVGVLALLLLYSFFFGVKTNLFKGPAAPFHSLT